MRTRLCPIERFGFKDEFFIDIYLYELKYVYVVNKNIQSGSI